MPAAENVKRQVTILVVIAVEEAAFLVSVQRIIRRIKIEDDLCRWAPIRLHEEIDEQRLDRRRIVAYLMIPRRFRAAQLQPVQRRLARQRRTVRAFCRKFADQNRQHRIVPQFVVVIEVFITQRDADNPLQHHRAHFMLHQFWNPHIGEAASKSFGQPDRPVRLAQQHCTGIRGDRSAIERGHHLTAVNR